MSDCPSFRLQHVKFEQNCLSHSRDIVENKSDAYRGTPCINMRITLYFNFSLVARSTKLMHYSQA